MSQRILIVDDEPNIRLSYRAVLETEGYVVEGASSGPEALKKLGGSRFDLAILDMRMPEMDGFDLLRQMRERGLSTPAVIITAYGDLPHAVQAIKLGAIDFLQKPLTPEQLRQVVAEIAVRHAAEPTQAETKDYLHYLQAAKRAINHRDFDKAIECLKKALTLDDSSAPGFNLAGVLAELRHDLPHARRYYDQALRLDPKFPPALQNLKRLIELSRSGKSAEPIALQSGSIPAHPDAGDASDY